MMQEIRDPQQPAPVTYYVPAPAPKAGRFLRFRRMARLLARRSIYGTVLAGRALRPYAATLVTAVVLLGVIGWMAYMLWAPKAPAAAFARADSLPPVAAVESFIQGQQNFNADMMWDAFSTEFQASQLASGASKATLQSQADGQRTMGLKFVRYDYIGGVKELDGGTMYFYSVDLRLRNQQKRFPMIFRADADGKIIEIQSPIAPQTGSTSGQ